MAAPKFTPVSPVDDPRGYESPDHIPAGWTNNRPGDLRGRQPQGAMLGYQGPDQGYALALAGRLRDALHLQKGEDADDVLTGVTAIGLRRASLFGRAPVIHDLRIAGTIWGFLDPEPPAELVATRRRVFEGLANVAHHYGALRALVDSVPEATLRMTPEQVHSAYPAQWRDLLGLSA
jgi:PAS domain-containing protein